MKAIPSSELPSLPLPPLAQRYSYHVITSAAQMPASNKFGRYVRVALIEVDHHERPRDYVPSRIVELRGVRIVTDADRLHDVGADTAGERARRAALVLGTQWAARREREAAIDAGTVESYDARYAEELRQFAQVAAA